jgi:transposase
MDRRSLVTVTAERKTSGLFISLLEALLRRHPDFRIHLILDNYIIHSSRQTRTFIEGTSGRIVLHFLPPYCPQRIASSGSGRTCAATSRATIAAPRWMS